LKEQKAFVREEAKRYHNATKKEKGPCILNEFGICRKDYLLQRNKKIIGIQGVILHMFLACIEIRLLFV